MTLKMKSHSDLPKLLNYGFITSPDETCYMYFTDKDYCISINIDDLTLSIDQEEIDATFRNEDLLFIIKLYWDGLLIISV